MVTATSLQKTIETIPVIILNVSILFLLTISYLQFYKITRKNYQLCIKTDFKIKSLLSICFYMILCVIGYCRENPLKCIIPLLGIIAGIDIFIYRIPTEFLFLLSIICIKLNVQNIWWMYITDSAISFILWYSLRNKLNMGLYDILLISILSLNLNGIPSVLLFSSAVLMMWGCAGLILQKVFRMPPKTKIPLAPIISFAFILSIIL